MTEEPGRKSHAMAWTLSILAVPVLYLLSYGPVAYLAQSSIIPNPLPKGLAAFYRPFDWIYFKTPLRTPLEAYLGWWKQFAYARRDPFTTPRNPRAKT